VQGSRLGVSTHRRATCRLDGQRALACGLPDLVTAATTAAVAGRPSGLQLRELLLALAHKHALGYAGGAGIVLWPRQPNLFYWAFGETVWALPSALSGYDLPDPDWDYGTDDGLTEVAGG
jgi:hypothetical protein